MRLVRPSKVDGFDGACSRVGTDSLAFVRELSERHIQDHHDHKAEHEALHGEAFVPMELRQRERHLV